MNITRCSIPKSDYVLCSQRWRSSIQSAKTRLGADYSSDHELFIAKFRLKLKEVWQTSRPFKYELNEIPHDYTHGHHQVTNTIIRLSIFFSAKDGDALYIQQKQDQELTVAQIMNSLLPDSDLN